MPPFSHRVGWLLLFLGCVSCGNREITVVYREVDHSFSWAERRAIERIADDTVAEARECERNLVGN